MASLTWCDRGGAERHRGSCVIAEPKCNFDSRELQKKLLCTHESRAVMCLYRIKYDRIKCDRIKYAFTGSYVFLQDHMCMLPDQVWPDQVWPDQMCFTWNFIHCIAILIYNSAIRLYPLVLEFCLYIMATSRKKSGSRVLTSHTGKVYCIEELGIILLFFTFVRWLQLAIGRPLR